MLLCFLHFDCRSGLSKRKMDAVIGQWIKQFEELSLDIWNNKLTRPLQRKSIIASLVLRGANPTDTNKALHQFALNLDYSVDSERRNFVSFLRVVSAMREDGVDANALTFISQVLSDSYDDMVAMDKSNWEGEVVYQALSKLILNRCFISVKGFSYNLTDVVFRYKNVDDPNLEKESRIIHALWAGPQTISFAKELEAEILLQVNTNPCQYICTNCCCCFLCC